MSREPIWKKSFDLDTPGTPGQLLGLRLFLTCARLQRVDRAIRRAAIDYDLLDDFGIKVLVSGEASERVLEGSYLQRYGCAVLAERERRLADQELAEPTALINARRLATLLGFEPPVAALWRAVVLAHTDHLLSGYLMNERESGVFVRALEDVLGLPTGFVREWLGPKRGFGRLGLVRVETAFGFRSSAINLFGDVDPSVLTALEDRAASDASLLAPFFLPAPPPGLGIDDFAHLGSTLGYARRILAAALAERTAGVNLLLHGPPGTGKTELARVLAAELGVPLHVISHEDADGDPASRSQRLGFYGVALSVLHTQRGLLLLDEADDLFVRGGHFDPFSRSGFCAPGGSGLRSFIADRLEHNAVPTIWIANEVDHLDPAILRRFAWVVALPHPPRAVRRNILRRALGDVPVGADLVERLVSGCDAAPADLARVGEIALALGPSSRAEADDIVATGLTSRLLVRDRRAVLGRDPRCAPAYDLGLVNADRDLGAIVERLRGVGGVTLLLHGPPGTGKTAFARHLAGRLGRDLVVKRASDLLSMYVGGTEQRLAAMFREADVDREVLLLDEADSFLQDRRRARNSWEVTQVNELLVQMEAFAGLFVCATNLVDDLDAAAFRRFPVQVRFGYARPAERRGLLAASLVALGVAVDEAAVARETSRLARLDRLTPGDFATVCRRLGLLGEAPDCDRFVGELEQEHAFQRERERGDRPLGFGSR